MDIILILLGLACMIIGLLGSFLPALPGPSLSWIGMLLLYFTKAVPANYWVLGIGLLLVILLTLFEYMIPAKGTKKYGGSTYGIWGTNIGLVVGLLSPVPLGFILGPFLGALIGELVFDSKDHQRAWKAATGSLMGLLVSSFIKFVVCMMFLGGFLWTVWHYKTSLF